MPKLPTLYLIDGSSYIFRAFYAIRPLTSPSGLPTNAIYGFTQMLMRLLREEKPTHLMMVFDSKEPTERDAIYPDYKANRSEPPDDLVPQFPYFQQVTAALRIPTLVQPGVEADDIIGTLAKSHEAAGGDVVIVTGDKDFMQLVSTQITLLDTMKEKRSGVAEVQARFGVPPHEVVEIMGLCGDAVDNIPGVKGVGPKTAEKLIAQFHSVENLYQNLDKVPQEKLRTMLAEQRDGAFLSRNLVEIRTQLPLQWDFEKTNYQIPSPAEFAPLFQELGFTKLLRDMAPQLSVIPPSSSTQDDKVAADAVPVQILSTPDQLRSWVSALPATASLTFELLSEGDHPLQSTIIGLALSAGDHGNVYIPVGHAVLEAQLSWTDFTEIAAPLWQNTQHCWWGYDVKSQLETLHAHGIEVSGPTEDGLLMQYLLGGATAKDAETFLERADHAVTPLATLLGSGAKKKRISDLSIQAVADWAAQITSGLQLLLPQVKQDMGVLAALYQDLEIPLLHVLQGMEETGVRVDTALLHKLSQEFGAQLKRLETEVHALVGQSFNLQSPKQLADVLFGKMQLPVLRKTKTGPSTDADVLAELAVQYPIAKLLIEHRQLAKLKSTYVDALPQLIDPKTGRIHTTYNQAVAATGRLSSSDPNLQNIPIRSDDGRKIRAAFVAADGSELVSADYSQIELRILAHLTAEPLLVEAFARDDDVHTLTAAQIFQVAPDQITTTQRGVGKTVNFAVLYGQSAFGLAGQLSIPPAEAKTYIDNYFAQYARVAAYREQVLEAGRQNGYVETLFGRRRQAPDLRHANKNLRSIAERMAFNTVFQGTAADIMKRAMLAVAHDLPQQIPAARMIMQVHDELIVETPQADVARVSDVLRRCMSGAAELAVPLTVDVGHGKNWAEC